MISRSAHLPPDCALFTRRERVGNSPAPDPLAGLSIPFRLQTHRGDGALVDVYQDTACTILAEEWSDVKGVFDGLTNNSIQATQGGDLGWVPILALDNGIPVIRFDGVNDSLDAIALGSISGQVTYSILMKSNTPTFNNYYAGIDSIQPGAGKRWGVFASSDTQFHFDPLVSAVWKNGVPLAGPQFPLTEINQWMVLTITTFAATVAENRAVGQLERFYFGDFDLIALIVHDPSDITIIEPYLQTLK